MALLTISIDKSNGINSAFASVECSANPFDQKSLTHLLPHAGARGMGVIAKRTLGNAPWRFADRPSGHYCETYWLRRKAMALDIADMPWNEFSLRFSAFAPTVSSAIVGTSSIANLPRNIEHVEAGPLPEALFGEACGRFGMLGNDWPGEI